MGKSTPECIVRGKVQKLTGLCFENILPLKLFAGFERLGVFDTVFSMSNITNPVNVKIFREEVVQVGAYRHRFALSQITYQFITTGNELT